MIHKFDTVINAVTGKPLPGVEVSVLQSGALASIYSDSSGTPLANPITTDENGLWEFYSNPGRYDLEFRYSGSLYQTIRDVSVGDLVWAADFGAKGDGLTDDTSALQNAVSAGKTVHLAPGATHKVLSRITIPAGVELHLNGATINSGVGFSGNSILKMAGDGKVIGPGTLDGTNVPAPTIAYASGEYQGVAIFVSGTQSDGRIENVTFQNFPSGPVLIDSTAAPTGFITQGCAFLNNQTCTTVSETNALVHYHATTACQIVACRASGYNWKAFYLGNSTRCKIVRCDADGGVPGHAAHYITGGSDNKIESCSHNGVGFGFKCFNSARPVVRDYVAIGSEAGGYFQGSTGFVCSGAIVENPNKSIIYVEDLPGVTAFGLIEGVRARRASAATGLTQVGIRIASGVSGAGGAVDGVIVRGCRFENFFIDVHAVNTGLQQTNIVVENNESVGAANYSILLFAGSGRVSGNRIALSGTANAAITLASDGVTTGKPFKIFDNDITGAAGDNIQIGAANRINYAQVAVGRNRAIGGTRFLRLQHNANAADQLGNLVIQGNSGTGMGVGAGLDLTFNTTTATLLQAEGNSFTDASYVRVADSITNPGNVEVTGIFTYSGSPETVFKARVGVQYRRTDGAAGTCFYVKESGTGNTGWIAK